MQLFSLYLGTHCTPDGLIPLLLPLRYMWKVRVVGDEPTDGWIRRRRCMSPVLGSMKDASIYMRMSTDMITPNGGKAKAMLGATAHATVRKGPRVQRYVMGCRALRAVSRSPLSVAQIAHGQRSSLLPVTLFQSCTMSNTYQDEPHNSESIQPTAAPSPQAQTQMASRGGLLSPQRAAYI